MLHLHKGIQLLFSLLVLLAIANAADTEVALQQRQNGQPGTIGTGDSPSASPSSVEPSPTPQDGASSSPDSAAATSSPAVSTIKSTITEPVASTPSPTKNSETPFTTTSLIEETVSTSAPAAKETPKTTQTEAPITSSATRQLVTTILTVSGSKTRAQVFTTNALVAVKTSTPTRAASLDSNGGSDSSAGLSSGQKKTIIGVVVGVGGAILLGGIAVVAWRVWGRKKHGSDGGDDLIYPGSSSSMKEGERTDGSPFKSTLDQYHKPANVNTASNF